MPQRSDTASVWVCKYCIMEKGLHGADLYKWPAEDDAEAQAQHIESEHHIPVRREGETDAQALARFQQTYPQAGGPECKCPTCRLQRIKSYAF